MRWANRNNTALTAPPPRREKLAMTTESPSAVDMPPKIDTHIYCQDMSELVEMVQMYEYLYKIAIVG